LCFFSRKAAKRAKKNKKLGGLCGFPEGYRDGVRENF
jgi:hypothetical protein